jgi:hypothetical protein
MEIPSKGILPKKIMARLLGIYRQEKRPVLPGAAQKIGTKIDILFGQVGEDL